MQASLNPKRTRQNGLKIKRNVGDAKRKEIRAENTGKRESGPALGRALVSRAPSAIEVERGVIRNVTEKRTMSGGGAWRTTSKTRGARIVCWLRNESPNLDLERNLGSPIPKVTHEILPLEHSTRVTSPNFGEQNVSDTSFYIGY